MLIGEHRQNRRVHSEIHNYVLSSGSSRSKCSNGSIAIAFKSFQPFNRYAPLKTFHSFGMNDASNRFQSVPSVSVVRSLRYIQLVPVLSLNDWNDWNGAQRWNGLEPILSRQLRLTTRGLSDSVSSMKRAFAIDAGP